ncbi:hypothetical protein KIN20_023764 [Parelaphostrongylus tenuis]|uniref:Uncharacterized protein n=1 Tax=Parelaphostrongylus tenuis TaxID=148309 RepID=A0AAD5QW04_PARTN|nr:hypothetical protein KIN20_023764 [Parelaphostrongylus tenuis]
MDEIFKHPKPFEPIDHVFCRVTAEWAPPDHCSTHALEIAFVISICLIRFPSIRCLSDDEPRKKAARARAGTRGRGRGGPRGRGRGGPRGRGRDR